MLWNGPPWPNMRMFWNCSFACTVQWCMTIYHKPFFPLAEGHWKMLIYHFFLFKMQIRSDCNALIIAGYQCKSFISQFRIKSCGMDTNDPTWECFEILPTWECFEILRSDFCMYFHFSVQWCMTIWPINLFSTSWGPFENVNLPFFSIQNAN